MPMPGEDGGRSMTGRIFVVLEVLAQATAPMTLSDVSRRAELPLTTTHRMLADLVEVGAVEKGERGYRLGERVWRLGAASQWDAEMRRAAAPHAHALARETGAAVAVAALTGDRLMCIDTIRGRSAAVLLTRSGQRLPILATSAGKVLLATVAQHLVPRMLSQPIRRSTRFTPVLPKLVLDQLAKARRLGYATAYEEEAEGQSSVSVRIETGPGQAPMTLTALVPGARRTLSSLVPDLRRTAAAIGRSIVAVQPG